jgi:assimilatory nitrate reductase catalytic subunit
MTDEAPPARRRVTDLLRARSGPLTRDLVREPGGFGLGQVPSRLKPDAVTSMVCGFCSTGCSLDVHLRGGEAVNLTPTKGYPVNLGMACPKGWEALAPLAAADRAASPLLRDSHDRLVPVDWPTALDRFTDRFKAIIAEHGPESVAYLSTGQIPTEEMALLGAVAKFGMGLVHGDGNTRQCMATSVVAYKQAFGFDAPPYTYADFERSDVIVLIGSNLCIAHPIMWERIKRNPDSPEIVVIDPRVTETAMAATQHLAARPKTDLTLLYGLANLLIERDAIDHDFVAAHTTGFDDFATHVKAFPPDLVAEVTGVPVAQLERLADTVAAGERVSFWWTMGVNQSHQGVRTAQAIIDLALMTGSIGRPGTGANSITGQCNAMGSRLFSNTTNLLGGRDFTDAADRAEVAEILGIDVERVTDRPSLAYDQIIEGIHRGTIKGLWVIATNSAHSWINQTEVRELLDRLDFLVVQDLYATTETAQQADLVLPAAGWGEKDGTFINSERRIGRIRRVKRAPGEALADFSIFKLVAEAWGCGDLFRAWESPEAAFGILARLSAGRPCDFSGLSGYRDLDDGGVQWPHPAPRPHAEPTPQTLETDPHVDPGSRSDREPDPGSDRGSDHWDRDPTADSDGRSDRGSAAPVESERRLFADGRFFTPDGRARFVVDDPVPVTERPSARYPLSLLTGRGSSAQWHTGTRTSKSAVLRTLAPQSAYVEIAPDDAQAIGIEASEWVVIESARGSMRARALVTPTVPLGHVFVPMHDAATNRLTFPAFDPHSRQPSYKTGAVAVRPLHSWER